MSSSYFLRVTLYKTNNNDATLTVKATSNKGIYSIELTQPDVGTCETSNMSRLQLEWYLDAFFQLMFMDMPKYQPKFIQFDLSCMPSTIIATSGAQFTIRTLLEHTRRMLEVVEEHGIPTMVAVN